MFATFTPSARQAVVRSGMAAADAGRRVLGTEFLLLGLAEVDGFEPPLQSLGVTAADIRAEIDRRHGAAPPRDRELLATLGIDVDEVRRRAADGAYGPSSRARTAARSSSPRPPERR